VPRFILALVKFGAWYHIEQTSISPGGTILTMSKLFYGVRILVDISIEYYEQMVNRVAEHSRVHFILMNGVVVHDYQTGVRRRVVKILCNKSDAEMLRDATETLCPEALPELEQSIKRSREI
jgi:hypothetical protein